MTSMTLSSHQQLREEADRRKKVIRQTLQSVLSESQMLHAVGLCEREFPPEEPFSTSLFCQRLAETIPDVYLNHETRLTLLRMLRRSVSEQNVNRHTHVIEIPYAWREETLIKEVSPPPVTSPVTLPTSPALRQRGRERRQYPRKLVQLPGHYWAELDDTPTGSIILTDLSLGGARFRLLAPYQLKHKESLPLEFKLDDDGVTTILQNVQICWIQGHCVGVRWLDRATIHSALQAYLLP